MIRRSHVQIVPGPYRILWNTGFLPWSGITRNACCAVPILVAVPESHAGRLFDHVGLHVADVEASKRFYAGALAPLGLGITGEGEDWFSVDELFVSGDGPITSGLHVAFQAQDRETVDRFHAAAIEAGGRDNGALVKGRITRATTVPTSSTRMARMSRPCTTGR